jgi:methyl-accepting chemotaxis protein
VKVVQEKDKTTPPSGPPKSKFLLKSVACIAVVATAAIAGILQFSNAQYSKAVAETRRTERDQTQVYRADLDNALAQIYQNIRTLSFLPDVKGMDRHATNLSASSKETIQQIYNNLWSNVTVSEIYFTPESFEPGKIDPVTGKAEEPALMYDEMITGNPEKAGLTEASSAAVIEQPEVEDEEYALIAKQIAYFRQNYGTIATIKGLDVPILSGPAVKTCDNSDFNTTKVEYDRAGMVFSVPYYDATGKIKGVISAVVRLRVLAKFLPAANASLVNLTHGVTIKASDPGQADVSTAWVEKGEPDPALTYSEVVSLKFPDAQGSWRLWRGLSDDVVTSDPAIASVSSQRSLAIGFVVALSLSALALVVFASRRFVTPAHGLTDAIMEVAAGNLTADVPLAERKDILGRIARAVIVFRDNALSLKAAERERMAMTDKDIAERSARQREESERARDVLVVVEQLGAGLNRLADCNIRMTIDEPFIDMFEQIRKDFNNSLASFQSVLEKVLKSTVEIETSSAEMRDAASSMSMRTEQQAAAITQTSSTLVQISAAVTAAAGNAHQTRTLVGEARQCTTSSTAVVEKAISAMGRIEKASSEISQIIGVIDEIAFQTNLLALNAGVEAARAGEAGRGFAVVASEVRELAQRSAKAAKEIKVLINKSAVEVNEGVKLVAETDSSLTQIDRFVTSIDANIDAIATGANDQTQGLAQVTAAVNQIDQMTQQNAGMSEEVAALSNALAEEAQTLSSLVNGFKLNRRATIREPGRDAAVASRFDSAPSRKVA